MRFYPLNVLVNVRCIDYKEEVVGSASVHQQVVHGASVSAEHHAVEYLTVRCSGDIVGEDVVDKPFGIWSGDIDFAHVGHVKYSAGIAYGHMFFGDALVLYGHVKTCKGAHLCSEAQMAVMQACGFDIVSHDILYVISD